MQFCSGIEINDAFFITFTKHYTLPFVEIYIITVQFYKFSNTNTCRRKDVYKSKIPFIGTAITQLFQLFVRKYLLYK